jgi:hypothetical protein
MLVRELLIKVVGFGLVVAALVVGGVLVLTSAHAYNDYLNGVLGWGLIAIALITAGIGTIVILGVFYDERLRQRDHEVHITPRGAPPAPPPPWGMGDVGRPQGGVVRVGGTAPHGGGSPRMMAVAVSNIDGPLFIAALIAWTVITLIFFAPAH